METVIRESRINLEEYLKSWQFSSLLEKQPGESLSTEEIRLRLLRRAYSDEVFRRELLAHTRYVLAMAIEEGLGISRFDFVTGVKRVPVLEETPEKLYLKLPTCHKGCSREGVAEPPPEHNGSSCHVCGITFPQAFGGCDASTPQPLPPGAKLSRRKIEDRIREAAALDPAFKSQLLARPFETYSGFVRALCGGQLPAYMDSVREVGVIEDAGDEIHFIIPTWESFLAEEQSRFVNLS